MCITKYKFIYFEQLENSLWSIKNNKSKSIIGYIEWHPEWKQYVFNTCEDMVFNISCLNDVIDFIEHLKEEKEL